MFTYQSEVISSPLYPQKSCVRVGLLAFINESQYHARSFNKCLIVGAIIEAKLGIAELVCFVRLRIKHLYVGEIL